MSNSNPAVQKSNRHPRLHVVYYLIGITSNWSLSHKKHIQHRGDWDAHYSIESNVPLHKHTRVRAHRVWHFSFTEEIKGHWNRPQYWFTHSMFDFLQNVKYAERQATNSAPLIHTTAVLNQRVEYCSISDWNSIPFLIIWLFGSSQSVSQEHWQELHFQFLPSREVSILPAINYLSAVSWRLCWKMEQILLINGTEPNFALFVWALVCCLLSRGC